MDIELPTVVHAAQAALLIAAKEQRGATVWAVGVHQPDATVCVAEGDQVLSHNPYAHGHAVWPAQLLCQGDRQPEAPEESAVQRNPRRTEPGPIVILRQEPDRLSGLSYRFRWAIGYAFWLEAKWRIFLGQ